VPCIHVLVKAIGGEKPTNAYLGLLRQVQTSLKTDLNVKGDLEDVNSLDVSCHGADQVMVAEGFFYLTPGTG
jgi:glyoxylate carboligase